MSTSNRAILTLVTNEEGGLPSDRELVERLIAQEPNAAVITYRKYAPRIYRIVQRSMGPDSDAEDLTQDVFLRVFAKVHTLRDPEALGSFVLSVALRVIKWQLRQKRVRRILHLSEDGRVPEITTMSTDFEGRQAIRRLYSALDALPAEERLVFSLRHLEGMALEDVADAVGTSLSTAKRRLHRALSYVTSQIEGNES